MMLESGSTVVLDELLSDSGVDEDELLLVTLLELSEELVDELEVLDWLD